MEKLKLNNLLKDPNTNWKYIVLVVVLVLLIFVGMTVCGDWQFLSEKIQIPEIKLPERKIENETANWQTYKNMNFGISIKYPNDFKFDEFELDEFAWHVTFYKGEKLKILPGSPIDPYPIGLTIYNRGKDCGDCFTFDLQNIRIAGYRAVRAITNNPLTDDVWIYSTDETKVVRISYGAHNKEDKMKYDIIFNQILSTFTLY